MTRGGIGWKIPKFWRLNLWKPQNATSLADRARVRVMLREAEGGSLYDIAQGLFPCRLATKHKFEAWSRREIPRWPFRVVVYCGGRTTTNKQTNERMMKVKVRFLSGDLYLIHFLGALHYSSLTPLSCRALYYSLRRWNERWIRLCRQGCSSAIYKFQCARWGEYSSIHFIFRLISSTFNCCRCLL